MTNHTEKSTLKIPCGPGIKCEEGYGASVIDTQHGSVNLNLYNGWSKIGFLIIFRSKSLPHSKSLTNLNLTVKS